MRRNERDTLARSAMKLLCTLLGLIFIVMLGATFAFQHLLNMIHYTASPSELDPDILSSLSQISLRELHYDGDNGTIGGIGSPIINILLIGQDRRDGETQARSDSMILCTFHKETKKFTMTSFLRDLYVEIPGHRSNRINAAYASGGMTLLKKTIEENFNLHIDGSVEVDFSQFADIIDLLGGVKIELRQDEAAVINQETGSNLSEGTHTLSGTQALAYARIRKLDMDGDFSRTNRQRKVMTALLENYRQANVSTLIPLLREVLPMITTDLNHGQLLMLALEMVPHLSDAEIISQRIPADGTYTDQTIDGMAVLAADMDAARKLLRETLLEG